MFQCLVDMANDVDMNFCCRRHPMSGEIYVFPKLAGFSGVAEWLALDASDIWWSR